MRVPLPLTMFAVIALAGACGGGTPAASTAAPTSTNAGPTTTPAGTTAATATAGGGGGGSDPANVSCNDGVVGTDVAIVDFAFEPATIAADADDTVHWANNGAATHTVTFDNGKDCGSMASGESLTVLFLAPGAYPYYCDIHKTMTGTVTVGG